MAKPSLIISQTAIENLKLIAAFIRSQRGSPGLNHFYHRLNSGLDYILDHLECCQGWRSSTSTYKTLVLFELNDKAVFVKAFYDGRVNPDRMNLTK